MIGPIVYSCLFSPIKYQDKISYEFNINWDAHHDELRAHQRYNLI